MNYLETVDTLKQNLLIDENDKWLVAMPNLNVWAMMFGAIGAALASGNSKPFIVAVNAGEIKLFEVNRKTGAYMGILVRIRREVISKVSVSAKNLKIKSKEGNFNLMLPKKIRKFDQSEQIAAFVDIVKTFFVI